MALLNRTLMITALIVSVFFGLHACQNDAADNGDQGEREIIPTILPNTPDAGEEVMIYPTPVPDGGGFPNTPEAGEEVMIYPTPVPDEGGFPCGPVGGLRPSFFGWTDGDFVGWTSDESHIIFDEETRVMKVNVEGTRLDTVVDVNPGYIVPEHGIHADTSSIDARIVYTSCEFRTEDISYISWSPRRRYHYEIATVNLDGSMSERLTTNDYVDHYPVWSPDMQHIAFQSGIYYPQFRTELSVMQSDGAHQRVLVSLETQESERIRLALPSPPPLWSPDGARIAFFAYGDYDRRLWPPPIKPPWALFTVNLADSAITKVSDNTGAASWSPDGQRLAFVRRDGDNNLELFTITRDGSDLHKVADILRVEASADAPQYAGRFGNTGGHVSWSPDGAHILFICEEGICVTDLDGNLVGQSPAELIPKEGRPLAAWSADGTRIAIRSPGKPHANRSVALFTMARDGTDVQVLVRGGRSLVAENSRYEDIAFSIGSCTDGYVVSNPTDNPGLVKDCETLSALRDALVGDVIVNWSPGTPIDEWDGIVIEGVPSRVTGLHLPAPIVLADNELNLELNGILPPELADLEKLQTLNLGYNLLTGHIPQVLAEMTGLHSVYLKDNRMGPCIGTRLPEIWVDGTGLERC